MVLSAALVPTPAVVHVAGLLVEPARRYPKAEVVPISIDAQGLGRLVDFIDATFARSGGPRATATGPGLYAASLFYPAVGRFHLVQYLQHLDRPRPRGGGVRCQRVGDVSCRSVDATSARPRQSPDDAATPLRLAAKVPPMD